MIPVLYPLLSDFVKRQGRMRTASLNPLHREAFRDVIYKCCMKREVPCVEVLPNIQCVLRFRLQERMNPAPHFVIGSGATWSRADGLFGALTSCEASCEVPTACGTIALSISLKLISPCLTEYFSSRNRSELGAKEAEK